MSRRFIDDDLIQWEAFSSTGEFSLPADGRVVFQCLTDRERRPRSVRIAGDVVEAGAAIEAFSDTQLRELLGRSNALS